MNNEIQSLKYRLAVAKKEQEMYRVLIWALLEREDLKEKP